MPLENFEQPDPALKSQTNASTRIFGACSFQDITGQRIGKVITAPKNIEGSVFGDNDPEAREARRRKRIAEREKETNMPVGELHERDLLQGPQLSEKAISQDDIDSLFASLG